MSTLKDTETVEQKKRGPKKGSSTLQEKYKDMPIISVGKTGLSIPPIAAKKLNAQKDERVVVLKKSFTWYIAILPFHSSLKGYQIGSKSSLLFVHTYSFFDDGLESGMYKISDPIFSAGIDWYPIVRID